MSGAQTPTSSEAQRNVLFNPLAVPQAQDLQNKLAGQQLDLSNANMEQVSRVSAALLNEPDLAKRAELYPRYVGSLQSQGYAMHAPATLPDEGTLRMLAAQGVSSEKQYEYGAGRTAAQGALGALGIGSTGTGAGATPAAGQGPSFAGSIAGFESGGVSNPPENPRWPVAKGGPAGPHQFIASTWNSFAQANPDLFKGMTPDQILAARTDTTPVGPNGEDRSTLATNWYAGENAKALQASNIAPTPTNLGIAHALGAGGATKVLSAPDNTPLSQVIPETIPQNPQYGRMTVGDLKQRYARLGPVGGGTATASATPPTAPAGGGGTPGRTQVASTVPVALPAATTEPQPPTVTASGSTAQPAATPLPPDQAVTQAKATGQPVPVAGSQGLWALPSGNLTSTPPSPASAAAAPPAATTAQPATAPAPAPQVPLEPLLQLQPSGLTIQQEAAAKVAFAQPMTPAAATALTAHYQQLAAANVTSNHTAAQTNFERQRQAQNDALAQQHQTLEEQRQAEQLALSKKADARAEAEAKRAGLPTGYRLDDSGKAYRIDGLPPDPAVLEQQANAGKQAQRQFEQENTLRDEFQKLTSDFRIVQTSFENIRSAAKANDGAGDMSLLYNYVRLLDPTSVVRESEFAAAAASGSLGERVQTAYERIASGARMPESLRQSFIREGRNLYDNQLRSHNTVADQYEQLARDNGLEPKRVVTRFARPQDDAQPDLSKKPPGFDKKVQ